MTMREVSGCDDDQWSPVRYRDADNVVVSDDETVVANSG